MTISCLDNSVQEPGGDAAVVRVHGTKKALAITTDVTPALLLRRSLRRRQAGGGGSLAQSDSRRRARRWPSPTI